MNITAFIPLKKFSNRLPNKNFLPIGGKPLYTHLLRTLVKSSLIKNVVVYSSCEEFKNDLPDGVEFIRRPEYLDDDTVTGDQIYEEFINSYHSDYYLLGHVTSPFLKLESIELAIKNVLNGEFDSALSVKCYKTFTWYKGEPINYNITSTPQTQNLEPIFIETSGFYLFPKSLFLNTRRRIGLKPYLVEVSASESIDIDYMDDYKLANAFYESNKDKDDKN